ncbi:hypothetical protein DQ04_01181120 [Trypanosoma grayi]|uniref:hypothetical protein n=1 Tax=Trypanosoma grayi TaxID=71804 RepID=UPI0004F49252|nr:hypothetical protein DQ04_01181120 [Trypanosoma grayi]KEG13158.1 hypothetical protein DQ04_01181120 [Trypanosoma grayi]
MDRYCLDVQNQKVSTFWGIKDTGINYIVIDLQNNCLRNFEHFGTHPSLVELRLQGNKIESFMGLTRQPSLSVIDLEGNPIAAHPWYRIMALLVVGFSITSIDGTVVSPEEREIARSMGPAAALAVSYGWQLLPGKRSPEEYRQIIDECKYTRRLLAGHQGSFRTIAHAMGPYRQSAIASSAICSESGGMSTSNAAVVKQLSTRVKQLEELLRGLEEKLKAQQTGSEEALGLGHIEGLTGAELRSARTILFSDGIHMRSNVVSSLSHSDSGSTLGSLMFEGSSLVFLTFLSRARLAELELCDIRVEHQNRNSLLIQGIYGAAFDILFDDDKILQSVYKLLYLRRGMSVPPLRQSGNAEANTMLKKDRAVDVKTDDNKKSDINSSTYIVRRDDHKKHLSRKEKVEEEAVAASLSVKPEGCAGGSPRRDSSSPDPRCLCANASLIHYSSKDTWQIHPRDGKTYGHFASDSPTNNIVHDNAECGTAEASIPRSSSSRSQSRQHQQQEASSRVPRRRRSSCSVPSVPSRLPSCMGSSTTSREPSVGASCSVPSVPSRLPSCMGSSTTSREPSVGASASRCQPQPPSRVPRRRRSSCSVPSVPSRLPSCTGSSTTSRSLSVIVAPTKSPESRLRTEIMRFRIAESDSDSVF